MKDDEKRGETPRFFLRFFPRKYKYLAGTPVDASQ